MRIRIACFDDELLWVVDDVIGGLYSIDWKTLETKCVIDFWKLFQFGKFEIQSLLRWKEDYIIIIPREIDKNWILYNKKTGKLEYRKVIERKCLERLIAVDEERMQLYFFPLYINDPVFIIDSNTLKCSYMIENWCGKVSNNCSDTAWTGAYNGQYVFYPKKNTKSLVRVDCGKRKVDLLELDISKNIADVNYDFGELWILPIDGNKLYQIDENGLVVNTAELSVENEDNSIPDFVRIVVQKKYLFLLPYYRKGIYVYDKLKGKTYIIPKDNLKLEKQDKEIDLRYWEYCANDKQICFLPYQDKYIEIDLDNLAYKKKELSYSDLWLENEKISKCIWNRFLSWDSLLRETDDCTLNIYLKYIKFRKGKENNFCKNVYMGKHVWNILTTNFV